MKSYYIKTYGCQMNEHDTETIAGILERGGYVKSDSQLEAELVILNTCSIREKAAHKVFSDLGRLKLLKKKRPEMVIGVGGCVGKQEGANLKKRMPWVNVVFGPEDIRDHSAFAGLFALEPFESSAAVVYPKRAGRVRAWVSIIHGCNNYCSYCVVPYTRGPEKSREAGAILDEIEHLGEQGYKEVVLLGQNVNSYRDGSLNFPRLLEKADAVGQVERIRFVTSHPKDFSPELIEAVRDGSKVCESLHLPLQSGSSRVLKLMNRKYDIDEYMEKIALLRRQIPGCSITSDIIVGFPGEEESDFQQTMDALAGIEFDNIFAFAYSKRPGTKALGMQNHLDEKIKKERLNKVITLQKEISLKKNILQIGKNFDVLVEGESRKDPDRLTGRTRTNLVVNFKGSRELTGSIVSVEIVDASNSCLYGSAP